MTAPHRRPAVTLPVNTSDTYCHQCWTPPGQEHRPTCPAGPQHRRPLPFPAEARIFAGLLIGLPIGALLYVIGALIVWSLA